MPLERAQGRGSRTGREADLRRGGGSTDRLEPREHFAGAPAAAQEALPALVIGRRRPRHVGLLGPRAARPRRRHGLDPPALFERANRLPSAAALPLELVGRDRLAARERLEDLRLRSRGLPERSLSRDPIPDRAGRGQAGRKRTAENLPRRREESGRRPPGEVEKVRRAHGLFVEDVDRFAQALRPRSGARADDDPGQGAFAERDADAGARLRSRDAGGHEIGELAPQRQRKRHRHDGPSVGRGSLGQIPGVGRGRRLAALKTGPTGATTAVTATGGSPRVRERSGRPTGGSPKNPRRRARR